ncbi:MAG: uroporphyrinogen decarboxylase [Deltaproteobacteria bacterium]|nr:uroporphyrinogen decarboxylase [Deltaproteobacteria bacterium]
MSALVSAATRFLRACRREPTDCTPVWIMRQAGRYMPEYRALRARHGFLELCKTPELAAQVTLMPVERFPVDAAILFADILLVLEPMGVGLEFAKGDGPVIHRPVRTRADVDALARVPVADGLGYVLETVRLVRRRLAGRVPLIGFAGAPFTLASYVIEGGGSRQYRHTKTLMYTDPGAWHALMERLSETIVEYLRAQVAAGAQAVQVFDSWVGCLGPDDYRAYVLPHMRATFTALVDTGVPAIHFGTGTAALLELVREAGGDVIGLDWHVDLADAWRRVGYDVAVQGNLDPVALFAPVDEIRRRVARVLERAGGRPGHVFNLGHGVLPETPLEHVGAVIAAVHELSARS